MAEPKPSKTLAEFIYARKALLAGPGKTETADEVAKRYARITDRMLSLTMAMSEAEAREANALEWPERSAWDAAMMGGAREYVKPSKAKRAPALDTFHEGRHRNIYLVGCGSSKLTHEAPARLLYTSELFKQDLRYALTQATSPQDVFIVSAKFGLLNLDSLVEPYEFNIKSLSKNDRENWGYDVWDAVTKARTKVPYFPEIHVFLLMGEAYNKPIESAFHRWEQSGKHWPTSNGRNPPTVHLHFPLTNMTMGARLKFLTEKNKAASTSDLVRNKWLAFGPASSSSSSKAKPPKPKADAPARKREARATAKQAAADADAMWKKREQMNRAKASSKPSELDEFERVRRAWEAWSDFEQYPSESDEAARARAQALEDYAKILQRKADEKWSTPALGWKEAKRREADERERLERELETDRKYRALIEQQETNALRIEADRLAHERRELERRALPPLRSVKSAMELAMQSKPEQLRLFNPKGKAPRFDARAQAAFRRLAKMGIVSIKPTAEGQAVYVTTRGLVELEHPERIRVNPVDRKYLAALAAAARERCGNLRPTREGTGIVYRETAEAARARRRVAAEKTKADIAEARAVRDRGRQHARDVCSTARARSAEAKPMRAARAPRKGAKKSAGELADLRDREAHATLSPLEWAAWVKTGGGRKWKDSARKSGLEAFREFAESERLTEYAPEVDESDFGAEEARWYARQGTG